MQRLVLNVDTSRYESTLKRFVQSLAKKLSDNRIAEEMIDGPSKVDCDALDCNR